MQDFTILFNNYEGIKLHSVMKAVPYTPYSLKYIFQRKRVDIK